MSINVSRMDRRDARKNTLLQGVTNGQSVPTATGNVDPSQFTGSKSIDRVNFSPKQQSSIDKFRQTQQPDGMYNQTFGDTGQSAGNKLWNSIKQGGKHFLGPVGDSLFNPDEEYKNPPDFPGAPSTQGNSIPKGTQFGRINEQTPEQEQIFKYLQTLISPDSQQAKLAQGDPETYNKLEQNDWNDFSDYESSLYNNLYSSGSTKGSAYNNAGSSARQKFASQLSANRQNLQQNALKGLFSMGKDLLGHKPYDQFLTKTDEEKKTWEKVFDFIPSIIKLATFFTGL